MGIIAADTDISLWVNPNARECHGSKAETKDFSPEAARVVRRFHRTLPDYAPTPLVTLKNLAGRLGIRDIWVKDESHRFGLNAFKALGASYGMARVLAQKLHLDGYDLSFSLLRSPAVKRDLGETIFVTATEGNHGRAVAWAAERLGFGAVVYMPEGSSPARLEAIRSHGAEASIVEGNYDDAVRLAAREAEKNRWILLQDSSREGNETIPLRVMQGYLTMAEEVMEQLDGETPTHVFVQCGVGSFGAAVQAYFAALSGPQRPLFGAVEPTRAACLFKSARAGDGRPRKVRGSLKTIMAGLACGEPSETAWKILRDYADFFVTASDEVTMSGMRVLAHPVPGDRGMISGESGAVTLGLIYTILSDPAFSETAETLKLDSRSKVLLFSTEGDTDPEMYRKIVRVAGAVCPTWGDPPLK